MNPLLVVGVGFAVGILIAYSGVGAGALMTPLLILGGLRADVAVGSDLLFAFVTKVFAFGAHVQKRTIDRALLLRLAPGGIIGAIAGVLISALLHVRFTHTALEHILRIALAFALILAAAAILASPRLRGAAHEDERAHLPWARLSVVGFFVGMLVSTTSIGAGSLTLPLLLLVTPQIPLRRLVGTDITFAVILLVPTLAGHFGIGDVNVKLAALLISGSIPGVFVGANLIKSLPDRWFRIALSCVLGVVAVTMVR